MNTDKPNILIAVPTTGSVHYKTAAAVVHLAAGRNAAVIFGCDRPHDYARNRLVRLFLKHPTLTHLFFLDSDVEPPLDVLDRLLALDAPVASGCVRIAQPDGLFWTIARKNAECKYVLIPDADLPAAPFFADGCGAGCLLIRRDVLETMPWPWFKWIQNKDGSQMGEDIYFCKQLNAMNRLQVQVDPTVICTHHKTVAL